MDKTRKILMSSILTIALSASLIAGSTFAIFTSESGTNIAVTSGQVKVTAQMKNLATYSAEWNEQKNTYDSVATEINGIFTNGGIAEIDGNQLNIDYITLGDKVTFDIGIKNESNVSIMYRTEITTKNGADLMGVFDVTVDGENYTSQETVSTAWSQIIEAGGDIHDISVAIELPWTAGNEVQGKRCEFAVIVYAVQGNANPNDFGREEPKEPEVPDDPSDFVIDEEDVLIGYTGSDAEVVIPEYVVGIGEGVFYGNTVVESVSIPAGVKFIGNLAFADTGLKNIEIPANVKSIGEWAFADTKLTSVDFKDGSELETIGAKAFYGCKSLGSMEIPASVQSIGAYAFSDCERLENVTLPENITAIDDYAFAYCAELTSITIPANVETIGRYAFRECAKLTTVAFGDGSALNTIGEWAFYGCISLELGGISFDGNWADVTKVDNWNYGTKI